MWQNQCVCDNDESIEIERIPRICERNMWETCVTITLAHVRIVVVVASVVGGGLVGVFIIYFFFIFRLFVRRYTHFLQ